MKKVQNNWFLLIVSFVFAVILWLGVMNTAKPLIDDFINVPIEIKVMNDENMENLGHVYTLVDAKTVRMSYKVRSDLASTINRENIKAYVQVSNTTNFSENLQVHIEYLNPEIENIITSVNIYPQLVSVRVSDLITKYYDIIPETRGKLSDNANVGGITISPNGINVSGAKEDLDRISEAKIEVILDGRSDTFTDNSMVKLYDKDKREIRNTHNIFISNTNVDYTVLVYHNKDIVLNPVIIGEVIDGCTLTSVDVEPKIISISGPRSYLDVISSIDLPEIDITGVSESKTIESFIPSEILPIGINYIGTDEKIDVKVNVSGAAKIIIAPKQNTEE